MLVYIDVTAYNTDMIERLQYTTDEAGRIIATMPVDLLHETFGRRASALREACAAADEHVIARREDDGRYSVVIDPNRMGMASSAAGQRRIASAMHGLSELEMVASVNGCSDELVEMTISTKPVGYGHMFTDAEIRRPFMSDERISQLGTEVMRRVAVAIRTPLDLSDIGTVFETERGASFMVSSVGSSTMDTDGNHYDSRSATIELVGHNIYAPSMQLICLSGVLRVATYARQYREQLVED